MCRYLLLFCLCVVVLSGCGSASTSDQFFYVPWPSDTRWVDGGNVLASGQKVAYEYPGAESRFTFDPYHLFANHVLYRQGAKKMDDPYFGVNSAVFFTFEEAVDDTSLPQTVVDTYTEQSPVQLVNVDVLSTRYHERVPLMIDFKTDGTVQRPANLLSLLPYPGFTLDYHSRYAAIVFDDVENPVGRALSKKRLYDDIEREWDSAMSITKAQHAQWQRDRPLVEAYVSQIGRDMSEVVAYTIFTTQHPAKETLALRDALQTLDDEDIQSLIVYDEQQPDRNPTITKGVCEPQASTDRGQWVTLSMHVRLPRWQQGTFPYLLSGGKTQFTMEDGKVQIPEAHEVVITEVAIPCDSRDLPNAYIVGQGGNNSTASDSVYEGLGPLKWYSENTGDVLVIGVGDLISGPERRTEPGVRNALALIRTVAEAGGFADREILPAIRNGYFNPVAARGNMRQAAAEAYVLKRIAENMESIAAHMVDPEALARAGLSLENFSVDKDRRVGLAGFSQGGNNSLVNMVMDKHYDFIYVGSGAGFDLPLVADKPPVKALLRVVFPQLEQGELDLFHPIGSFVQMAFEPMDASNYVPYVSPTNLFITAGAYDTNVPPLATEHMAIALARRGLIGATAGGQGQLLDVKSFSDVLQMEPLTHFPISGNILSGQGTGVFSYGSHGHYACGDVGGFLHSATRGQAATLRDPC